MASSDLNIMMEAPADTRNCFGLFDSHPSNAKRTKRKKNYMQQTSFKGHRYTLINVLITVYNI